MTASVPALRFHSVMLGVTDVERSVTFYTERLGFALRGRFEQFAFLDAGGTTIALSGSLARARAPGAASVEVVLAVDGVRAGYDALRERGVEFVSAPHTVDGTNDVANFTDPDGHLFTLYGPP